MAKTSGHRDSHALIVGKFAPLHKGHQLLIEAALAEAGRVTILVYANPDFTAMPQSVRAGWLRALYPAADVHEPQGAPPDDADDHTHRAFVAAWLAAHNVTPDVVFTSESYGDGFAAHLGVPHRLVDIRRAQVPISGTLLRGDLHGYRHFLDPIVYGHFIDKVVLMGAESTGKSTLTQALARHFATGFVAEYGREVYEAKGGVLVPEDYVAIAEGHRAREDAAVGECRDYLFVDTNAVTTMFFSHYYNRISLPRLRDLAEDCRMRYRHVIVCDDDIPFEQDGWRDNDVWRGRMQGMVLHDLSVRGIAYTVVTGDIEHRITQVEAILAAAAKPTDFLSRRC